MGPRWRVVAPARKEATGCLGELFECLMSGSASGLVPLLAVPLKSHRCVECLCSAKCLFLEAKIPKAMRMWT